MFGEDDFRESTLGGSECRVRCFGCSQGVSKSVQVPLNGVEAVLELSLIVLTQRALE